MNPTTNPRLRVFLCGTYSDIRAERDAVLDAIERLGLQRDAMELFGARSEQPLEACLKQVRQSDVLVVVVAHRYGSLVPGSDISFSEAEYREGFTLGKPCLVYMRSDQMKVSLKDVERDPRKMELLAAYRETLRSRHTCFDYDDAASLVVQVAADLSRTKGTITIGGFIPSAIPSSVILTTGQLAERQTTNLKEVWVYAPQPLETLPSRPHRALRKQVCDNILAGVRYVYFVESEAGVGRIEDLLSRMASEQGRPTSVAEILKSRTTIVVLSLADFFTYYTVHFSQTGELEVFQSLITPDRNDVLVKLADVRAEHIRSLISERMNSMEEGVIEGMRVLRSVGHTNMDSAS